LKRLLSTFQLVLIGTVLVVAMGTMVVLVRYWYRSHLAGADLPQPYLGTTLDAVAPDFRLTDQTGVDRALSDFRGKVVVLAFLDSECEDICPLTGQQLRKTYESLGPGADSVVFLGVNVNTEAAAVAAVAAATENKKWGLAGIPSWHFLTGSPQVLKPVWKAYSIAVEPAPDKKGEILHTPGVYLIDPNGRERWYISVPSEESGWQGPALSDVLRERIELLLRSED
jgi:protein SCO1/2